jgi:hypothetical protein
LLGVARGFVRGSESQRHGVGRRLFGREARRGDDGNGRGPAREEPVDRDVARRVDRGRSKAGLVRGLERGRLLVVSVHIRNRHGTGEFRQLGILGRCVRCLAGAARELAKAFGVDPVAGGAADAAAADHPQEDADVLDQGRLMDLGDGEACEPGSLRLDDCLDAVALRRGDGLLGEVERAHHAGATPTWTLRNRAGAAPWLTCACWPGWPLPQLVRP